MPQRAVGLPDEIQNPASEEAYWEIEKLLYQGLRGDANTLETLWSPLHKVVTPLGQVLSKPPADVRLDAYSGQLRPLRSESVPEDPA